jgi:ribose 5-phosphate isomerase B
MKIAVGADHAGFRLKEEMKARLAAAGHVLVDHGTATDASVDYPDFAAAVGRQVVEGSVERGILFCSSGVGMSIAANKIHGIRAALAVQPEEVRLTRAHNDINILALGAKFTSAEEAAGLIDVFLTTAFEGGRHERRLNKIKTLEESQ